METVSKEESLHLTLLASVDTQLVASSSSSTTSGWRITQHHGGRANGRREVSAMEICRELAGLCKEIREWHSGLVGVALAGMWLLMSVLL